MKMANTIKIILMGAAATTGAMISGIAYAQSFPLKPIKLVVPYAAGGAMDAAGRIVATELTKVLGQPVVVDNRSGGAGTTGTHSVVRSAPDG